MGNAAPPRYFALGLPTRRDLGRVLGGVLWSLARAAWGSDKLTWNERSLPAEGTERRYRADAQVIVLSLPLLHRTGVGGGSVVWREAVEPEGGLLRFLEFNGFSLPARAAGLNRLGFIREMSRRAGGHTVESIYFGLMTAAPEESAEQARKSLHSNAKELAYTAIDCRIATGVMETTTAHFAAPSSLSAEHRTELMERARQALAGATKSSVAQAASPSFLQALADRLVRPDNGAGVFVYAGRSYSLATERSPDAKATSYFLERRLIPQGGSVIRVSGKLRRQTGGKETEFRLWVEHAAARPIPLRIEYRAKPYLRLIFEAEGA